MQDISIAMGGPDATEPNNRRLHVDGEQWAKVYGFTPEQSLARANIICRALAGPVPAALTAFLDADEAFREFERANPNNSTSAWDRVFYARNLARDALYVAAGREAPR